MLYLLCLFLTLHRPTPVLELKIAPEKQTFEMKEAINLLVSLENKGSLAAVVDKRFLPGPDESFGQEITLLVTGPKEHPLPYLVLFEPSTLNPDDLEILGPRHSLTQTLTLSNAYVFGEEGTYQVQAIYDTTLIQSPVPFWRGRLVSLPITFEVRK